MGGVVDSEPLKILAVDDVEDNLSVLEEVLRRDQLEILKARSGKEALELLLVHDVALALLDVQMPDIDGFELASLMRGAERTKNIPIIFVTANPRREFKGYEQGAVDYLVKPIEPAFLTAKVDVFLELYRQKQELKSFLRLHEMFVGILGHDLRNPLGTMLDGIQLVQRNLPDDKHTRTLQLALSAGLRMNKMIEQLLDLTRARLAGGAGFVVDRAHVDVAQLAQRAVAELRVLHPSRKLAVEAKGNYGVAGDAERLAQILSNLVANALHHGSPDGVVTVTVEGTLEAVCVSVHNRGAIAANLVAGLFDPFRARPPSGSRSRGLGLGLFISRQIALAHGGDIHVASSDEAGTMFTVVIPRAESADGLATARFVEASRAEPAE
jgi:two-component system sensor histidine kinase/response regulator